MTRKNGKKLKLKLRNNIATLIIITVIMGCMAFIIFQIDVDFSQPESKITTKKQRQKQDKKAYNDCLEEAYTSDELNETLSNKIDEVNNIIKQYDVYVKYDDLTTGFTYGYRQDEVLYGASLIKLVDAIYLLDNDIDLNQTKKYTSNYKESYSYGLEHVKLNSDVSIKDLLKHALTLSDNSAHLMLLDFIGKDNLKAYGKSLGALHTLEGTDKFGNQSATDMSIYLKRAYELFNSKENGPMIKDFMMNYYQNNLYLESINNVAHKYGSYGQYYHDVGIVDDDKPYTVVILTKLGYNENIIRSIHAQIKQFIKTKSI